jgi:hypothetical protein
MCVTWRDESVAVDQGPVNRSIGDNNMGRRGSAASYRRYLELNADRYIRMGSYVITVLIYMRYLMHLNIWCYLTPHASLRLKDYNKLGLARHISCGYVFTDYWMLRYVNKQAIKSFLCIVRLAYKEEIYIVK